MKVYHKQLRSIGSKSVRKAMEQYERLVCTEYAVPDLYLTGSSGT